MGAKRNNGNGKRGKVAAKLPALVVQHGGGALLSGGLPGHKPGPGRPPDVVKQLCRDAFQNRIPILTSIADGEVIHRIQRVDTAGSPQELKVSAEPRDRIKALELLGRAGKVLGTESVMAGGEVALPDGTRFTLILGERDDT